MKKIPIIGLLFLWSLTSIHAHPSWGIVVDKDQNIYFADILHNGRGSVWKLAKDGTLTLLLSDFHAHNVSLDKNGNPVSAHGEENHTMVRLQPDGSIDTLYHTLKHQEFFGGNCTYSVNSDIIFGIEKYIWRIGKNGKKQKVSDHKLEWNQAVYADGAGNIYAPDIGRGNGIIVKISANGHSEVIARDIITKLNRPFDPYQDVILGITKGCDSLIYAAETAGKRIVKIAENGNISTFYTSADGWFPTGIDFHAGDAYILEYRDTGTGMEGPQIVKIAESGKRSVLFNYDAHQRAAKSLPKPVKKGKMSPWYVLSLVLAVFLGLWFIIKRKINKNADGHIPF